MNDELETTEYLKKLEHLKLADSTRLRMREDLLAHVRFHAVEDTTIPITALSPFWSFFMRPAPIVLVIVLFVGTTAFLLQKDKQVQVTVVDEVTESNEVPDSSPSPEKTTPSATEETDTKTPTLATNTPVPNSQPDTDVLALGARAKSAPAEDSAADMMMTTELSAGTWSIADHAADVTKRIEGLRAIVKKYDADITAETKAEFTTKLDTADKLKIEAEGKEETDARANLDKASVLLGEVEATLSTLGEVVVEDGYITDVKFQ